MYAPRPHRIDILFSPPCPEGPNRAIHHGDGQAPLRVEIQPRHEGPRRSQAAPAASRIRNRCAHRSGTGCLIAGAAKPSGLSLFAVYERYAATGTANPKTVVKWRAGVADLVRHLGHNDATRVTRADLNRWVEALIARGLTKKTVRDG